MNLKRYILSTNMTKNEDLAGEQKKFSCELGRENLFSCILNEFTGKDLEAISKDPSRLKSESIVNCLNAGLITCIGKQQHELLTGSSNPEVEFHAVKNENGLWRIRHVNLVLNKYIDNGVIIKRIEQCLKYIKTSCSFDKSVTFDVTPTPIGNDLKSIKINLLELKDWVSDILGDRSKHNKLFEAFNQIDS